ncbi:MAG: hypothetical protein IKK57_13095 [Clostridia bacterium]|nr:hypothetical protein [Clostridia bacterium]
MQDRHPLLCTLALCAPLAALMAAGIYLAGPTVKNAIFAALKLVVIR